MHRSVVALALAAGATACRPPHETPAAAQQTSSSVVDSVMPRDVALQQFRECCARVDSLSGGALNPDALIHRFVRSIETRDTASLRALLLNRDEFAWLYYETTPQGLPPYNLSPALMWFLLEGNSGKGLGRALSEYGGRSFGYVDHACHSSVAHEGANAIVGPCIVRRVASSRDTVAVRLFGLLLERGGRWKFITYANKL